MRPVNLIPPEDRRTGRGPTRTGPFAYGVLALLAVALIAVTAVVLTENEISDREAEVASLEAQEAQARATADRLRPFAEFASLQEARRETVRTLAQSRFDWERVLRELAIVLPSDVWLVKLTATVTPSVEIENGAEVALRDSVPGPALEMVGCGASHEAVARFAAGLEDIDGVTRVAVGKSERPDQQATEQGTGATGGDADCRTRDFISQFEIVVAFDEVEVNASTQLPVPPPATTAPVAAGGDAG